MTSLGCVPQLAAKGKPPLHKYKTDRRCVPDLRRRRARVPSSPALPKAESVVDEDEVRTYDDESVSDDRSWFSSESYLGGYTTTVRPGIEQIVHEIVGYGFTEIKPRRPSEGEVGRSSPVEGEPLNTPSERPMENFRSLTNIIHVESPLKASRVNERNLSEQELDLSYYQNFLERNNDLMKITRKRDSSLFPPESSEGVTTVQSGLRVQSVQSHSRSSGHDASNSIPSSPAGTVTSEAQSVIDLPHFSARSACQDVRESISSLKILSLFSRPASAVVTTRRTSKLKRLTHSAPISRPAIANDITDDDIAACSPPESPSPSRSTSSCSSKSSSSNGGGYASADSRDSHKGRVAEPGLVSYSRPPSAAVQRRPPSALARPPSGRKYSTTSTESFETSEAAMAAAAVAVRARVSARERSADSARSHQGSPLPPSSKSRPASASVNIPRLSEEVISGLHEGELHVSPKRDRNGVGDSQSLYERLRDNIQAPASNSGGGQVTAKSRIRRMFVVPSSVVPKSSEVGTTLLNCYSSSATIVQAKVTPKCDRYEIQKTKKVRKTVLGFNSHSEWRYCTNNISTFPTVRKIKSLSNADVGRYDKSVQIMMDILQQS